MGTLKTDFVPSIDGGTVFFVVECFDKKSLDLVRIVLSRITKEKVHYNGRYFSRHWVDTEKDSRGFRSSPKLCTAATQSVSIFIDDPTNDELTAVRNRFDELVRELAKVAVRRTYILEVREVREETPALSIEDSE